VETEFSISVSGTPFRSGELQSRAECRLAVSTDVSILEVKYCSRKAHRSPVQTYRRSAAGARGSGATDKPVRCNTSLASVRCPPSPSPRHAAESERDSAVRAFGGHGLSGHPARSMTGRTFHELRK